MLNIFEDDLSKEGSNSFVYADSASRYQVQLPLAIPWYTQSGVTAEDLYNDDDSRYVTYSPGENETLITSRLKDRFGGLSIEVVSGIFSGYVQVYDESAWDPSPPTIAGPYTISGDTSGDVLYISTYYEEPPEEIQPISFSGAGSYKVVFPNPAVCRSFKLVHSGESAYQISRIIPRRAVQSFDLEVNAIKAYHVSASLIETIALEVSESIVIGPDLIGDKTIGGNKIIDGTVSGVIITPGTITGNLIQAGTISGVLITAGTLTADRIASKSLTASQIQDASLTGALIQAGTVSGVLITDGTIAASKIIANTITGDKIAASTISGALITAGAITADKLSVTNLQAVSANTGNLSVNGNLTVTSGQIDAGLTTITQNGITVGNFTSSLPSINRINILGSGTTADIVGMAFYNSSFSTAVPLFNLKLDSVDVVEFDNNQSTNAQFNFNFPDNSTSTFFNIFNGDLNIKRTGTSTTTEAPVIEGYNKSGTLRYKVSAAETISAKFTAGTNYISNSALSISTDADFFNDIFVWSELGGVLRIADNNFIPVSRFLFNTTNFQSRNASNLVTFDLNNTNGNTRVYGDFRVDANFTQFNFGSMTKNTAQTVNAGVTAKITFQVAGANGVLDDLTNNQINIVDAGLYLIVAGVVSTTLGLPWQVVSGGAFNSGVLLAGVTQAEGRAYSSKMLYLNPGELELWLSNTGGTNAAISTGNNGAILSVVKVG
jgi:hypothetical protein